MGLEHQGNLLLQPHSQALLQNGPGNEAYKGKAENEGALLGVMGLCVQSLIKRFSLTPGLPLLGV